MKIVSEKNYNKANRDITYAMYTLESAKDQLEGKGDTTALYLVMEALRVVKEAKGILQ